MKKHEGITNFRTLKSWNEDNREGFVIRFENGFRIKIKMEEYVRLHRILTNISSKLIWEHLKDNNPLTELLELVPDEFYDWVKEEEALLKTAYTTIEDQCKNDFKRLDTRKETALYFQTCQYPAVLFNMLDNKAYSQDIWKQLKPLKK